MTTFILRRLLALIPTLLLVITLVFFLVRLAPGGPFDSDKASPPEIIAVLEARYNMNAPLWDQYTSYLGDVIRGDLGPSTKYQGRTVNEIIGASLPVSMELGFWALLFALAFGVPLGIVGAVRHNSWKDSAAMAVSLVGISFPRFVVAPFLVFVFSLRLYWLPVARWESWQHMVLPVICAGLPTLAYVARLTRGGMLEVVRSDFVRTAQAKGLPERTIITRHALKGGLLPVVSYLGPGFSALLVGSLVIEQIFSIPGMGRYFVEAAINRDYNLVAGVTIVYGGILMVLNALVDVAYAWLDPRVKLA